MLKHALCTLSTSYIRRWHYCSWLYATFRDTLATHEGQALPPVPSPRSQSFQSTTPAAGEALLYFTSALQKYGPPKRYKLQGTAASRDLPYLAHSRFVYLSPSASQGSYMFVCIFVPATWCNCLTLKIESHSSYIIIRTMQISRSQTQAVCSVSARPVF
jgi:hypothetical protein